MISLIDTGTIACLPLIWIDTRNDHTWTSARNKAGYWDGNENVDEDIDKGEGEGEDDDDDEEEEEEEEEEEDEDEDEDDDADSDHRNLIKVICKKIALFSATKFSKIQKLWSYNCL